MLWNSSKTISCVILSVSLATTTVPAPRTINRYCVEQSSRTISTDAYIKMGGIQVLSTDGKEETPYEEAVNLYGVQSNFTNEEWSTYWNAIGYRAEETGVNVFDLF